MTKNGMRAIHPGEYIADALDDLAMRQTELADILGFSKQYINDVLRGRKGVSVELAIALPIVLGSTPEFWLGLQQEHDLKKAAEDKKVQEKMKAVKLRNDGRFVERKEKNPRIKKAARAAA